MHGTQCMAHNAWDTMHGTHCMAHNAWHTMHGTHCMAHNACPEWYTMQGSIFPHHCSYRHECYVCKDEGQSHADHQRVARCSVTLGDEEAKKRGVQKSVRERAGPPTFDCCIEMEDRQQWNIYEDVASATDALLAGVQPGCLPACACVSAKCCCELHLRHLTLCNSSTWSLPLWTMRVCLWTPHRPTAINFQLAS